MAKRLVEGIHYALHDGVHRVDLGEIHGFGAVLLHDPRHRTYTTRLSVGCRCFDTKREAIRHWKHGNRWHAVYNIAEDLAFNPRDDAYQRPHAKALIEYASAICKTNGWKW